MIKLTKEMPKKQDFEMVDIIVNESEILFVEWRESGSLVILKDYKSIKVTDSFDDIAKRLLWAES